MKFIAAKNKLEAVARISNLTESGPELLGPGSKEHKSVFFNLSKGLGLKYSSSDTKQELAKNIVTSFGGIWDKSCESSGQTITLIGLNRMLAIGEKYFATHNENYQKQNYTSAYEEAMKIAEVVIKNVPKILDGKECIKQMRFQEDSRWRQVQWQGFYIEMILQATLTNLLGGGRKKLVNTVFDYSLENIWDIKTHSDSDSKGKNASGLVILNDSRAVDLALQNGGLGLILLSGIPTYDYEFTKWHKIFRGDSGNDPIRILKSKFEVLSLDMFFIPNYSRLELALTKQEILLKSQGKNSNGKPRPPKYWLNLNNAINSDLKLISRKIH